MKRALAILGTGSDVGKSLITAGICRLLYRGGIRVAPFKGQNMSLNSFVTPDGGEMGRAQVLQAQACGLKPHVDMNPVLLKPEADSQSQVIVQGKVWRSQEAKEYFEVKSVLFKFVQESFYRLAGQYEVLVIEGAGSAAEMNLRDRDIVNWPVVEMADASVILIADIDRGGVFAQVIGTIDLLSSEERRRVIGVIINKFRGDLSLFHDGVKILEERTGLPVLGVLPYLRNVELDQEDSVDIERSRLTRFSHETVNVAIVLLPHMSNFTDFNQLTAETDVALRYVSHPNDIQGADVVILPGSKTTLADLDYLREQAFDTAIQRHRDWGGELVGLCGGFQMLGVEVADPLGVETGGVSRGFEMLDIRTEMDQEKSTVQVAARAIWLEKAGTVSVEGYEIHMGKTRSGQEVSPCFEILSRGNSLPTSHGGGSPPSFDGAMSPDGRVWGSYIHGVFDSPDFRRAWLNHVRARKKLPPLEVAVSRLVSDRLEQALDRWADHVGRHLNMAPILSALNILPKEMS